ncbi:hypothetical protein Gxy13693_024_025 [Komagataeibacter xylinus NBRC 13693]|uniref:Uncharacterized protein n=1 Tax=Komagataeibacter xylinus NBRC 13693 TaxID=1234668 RepID=A0A0D6Q836_KOMXY|nr:hypothetical protein Gxy13693_024_025 [Komagataeibacter xylinus NBRC 13693]
MFGQASAKTHGTRQADIARHRLRHECIETVRPHHTQHVRHIMRVRPDMAGAERTGIITRIMPQGRRTRGGRRHGLHTP